eukprot:jgi/Ulvmu1/10225/UM060_0025.1
MPTCGWYLLDGVKVIDSQGFCCSCSSGQIWQDTVGDARQATRAGLNCDYFANPFLPVFGSPPGSAHCLVYQPSWWEVYNVHESAMDFDITISINTSAAQPPGPQPDSATGTLPQTAQTVLNPSNPRASAAGGLVSAQLVGDLLPYRAFPVLTSQLLLMPELASVTRLQPAEWMLLDRGMVTLDGSECNKIGVGFTAFRYQSEKCGRTIGSCLGNQLPALQEEDAARQAAGQQSQHLASRYAQAGVQTLKLNLTAESPSQQVQLAFPVAQVTTTLLSLEVAADGLTFIQNAAPGKIVSGRVCNAAGTVCDSVAALNSGALVMLVVLNTGAVAASYTVSFGVCSHPAQPVPAQTVAIDAGDSARITFEFYMTTAAAATDANCTATLYDSQNEVTDEAVVRFSINATAVDGVAVSDGTREDLTGDGMSESQSCRDRCGPVNIPCLIWRRCGAELATVLGTCVGVLLLVCCCCYASRRGMLGWAVSALTPCSASSRQRASVLDTRLASKHASSRLHRRQQSHGRRARAASALAHPRDARAPVRGRSESRRHGRDRGHREYEQGRRHASEPAPSTARRRGSHSRASSRSAVPADRVDAPQGREVLDVLGGQPKGQGRHGRSSRQSGRRSMSAASAVNAETVAIDMHGSAGCPAGGSRGRQPPSRWDELTSSSGVDVPQPSKVKGHGGGEQTAERLESQRSRRSSRSRSRPANSRSQPQRRAHHLRSRSRSRASNHRKEAHGDHHER